MRRRPRRTPREHIADSFPLVGQRIRLGRDGTARASTCTILEYLTEKIVRLRDDSSGQQRTLSLEAHPFGPVRGGPDLPALLSAADRADHDRLARKWFRSAPRADLDVRDGCFAERLDKLLSDGYAPRAINGGPKMLHAEEPEVATGLIELRKISKKKGRGYAARELLAPGKMLLRERGLCTTLNNAEALAAAILLECAADPSCVWKTPGLCGACDDEKLGTTVRDSFVPCLVGADAKQPPSLAAWNTAREQVASNFFTTDRGNILQGYGSFFNHSCDPNAEWRFHANGQFVVRTIKNIKPREEVCIRYSDEIGEDDSVFACQCDACFRRRKRARTRRRKEVAQWVQCSSCNKWRKTTYSAEQLASLPTIWKCSDMPRDDGIGKACEDPEEQWKEEDEYELDAEEQSQLIAEQEEEEQRQDVHMEEEDNHGKIFALPQTKLEKKRKKVEAELIASAKEVAEKLAEKRANAQAELSSTVGAHRLQPLPALSAQLQQLFAKIEAAAAERGLAATFQSLPARVQLPRRPPFPEPMREAPSGLACGSKDMLVGGVLPSVAKQLPTEQQLRSWTWASQQAFWEQRRQHWLGKGGSGWWGSWKLGDLQRECRKRDIWPGGDRPFVVDRLLRADFCRSRLLSCETITEEQAMHEQSQIGYLYYRVVSEPIDLRSIRAKLAARQYATVKALESDLLLLCVNTKKFDSAHGQSNGQTARHANEIQRVVRAAVRSLLADEKRALRSRSVTLAKLFKATAKLSISAVKGHEKEVNSSTKK